MTRRVQGCDFDVFAQHECLVVGRGAGDGFAVFAADDGDGGVKRGEDFLVAAGVVPVVVRVDDGCEVEGGFGGFEVGCYSGCGVSGYWEM